MNSKFSSQVFVAKDAARTATQIVNPLTAGYPALGEVVLVDQSGLVVEANTITAKSQVLSVVMRSNDDKIYRSSPINGEFVKSAYLLKYNAPVQQYAKFSMSAFTTTTNFNFVVRIRDWKPRNSYYGRWKTAEFAVTTNPGVAAIAAGLAKSINDNFESDRNFPVVAASNNAGEVVIMGVAPYFEAGKYKYEHFRYVVEPANFTASVSTNLGASLTTPSSLTYNSTKYPIGDGVTYTKATIGDGSVNEIKELEWYYINNFYLKTGRRIDVPYEFTPIGLNVEAGKCYHKVVINLEYGQEQANNAYSTTLPSSIIFALPGTNQSVQILAAINKYLYTIWGVIPSTLSFT